MEARNLTMSKQAHARTMPIPGAKIGSPAQTWFDTRVRSDRVGGGSEEVLSSLYGLAVNSAQQNTA
jgi:hypothetical protein